MAGVGGAAAAVVHPGGCGGSHLHVAPWSLRWPAVAGKAASRRPAAAAQVVAAAVVTRVVVTVAVKAEVMAVEAVGGMGVARWQPLWQPLQWQQQSQRR